ncbi:AsmA family protein [Iodidimonas sp. SYSU 1G8]|uniref:AsmA family protein n=1 Tax=Iodidimonas sp. SYSU 1G8 TaxID=3133967 RepID=UPI0031FE574D
MKRAWIWGSGAAAAIIVAGFAVPRMMDWSDYRSVIEGQIEAATGREARIGGTVHFALLPYPFFTVRDVRVANPEGATEADFITAESVDIDVALLPLLSGKMWPTDVTLHRPRIALEVLTDGGKSWVFSKADRARKRDRAGRRPLSVRDFRARDATIVYRPRRGEPLVLAGVNMALSAPSSSGPFEIKGNMRRGGERLEFKLATGTLGNAPAPFDLRLNAPGKTVLKYRGKASLGLAEPAIDGTLDLVSRDANALLVFLGGRERPGLGGVRLGVKGTVTGGGDAFTARGLQIALGDTSATGEAELRLGDDAHLDLRLDAQTIDLDAVLAADTDEAESEKTAALLPGTASARLRLNADTVLYRQQALRNIVLDARVGNGQLQVPALSAELPGRTSLTFKGGEDAGESLSGTLRLVAGDPRAFLAWAGLDLTDAPDDRLKTLTASADVSGDTGLIKLDNLLIKLDGTTIDGWIDHGLKTPVFVTADLQADRLDLDAYASRKDREQPFDWSRFAFLADWDADIRVGVTRLGVADAALNGAVAEIALKDGVMTVRRAGAQGADGGSLALEGTVTEFGRPPRWKLIGTLTAERLGDIVSLGHGNDARHGLMDSPVALALTSEGNAETATFSATGTAGGTDVSLSGERKTWNKETAELVTRLELKNGSWAAFARQAGLAWLAPLDGHDGPFSMKGTLTATGDVYKADLVAELAGGRLLLAGPFSLAENAGSYELTMTAQANDAARFLRAVGVAFRPDPGGAAGGFMAKGALKRDGKTLTVADLHLETGAASVNGRLSWDESGARPRVEASIEAGSIDIDQFLPPRDAGPDLVREPGGARWSDEPFAFEGLRGVDGRISVKAERIAYRRYAFDKPALDAVLDQGVLRVGKFDAGLFSGRLSASGSLDLRAAPAVNLDLAIEDASVGEALAAAADVDFATGRFAMKGRFAARGASERDMIATLNGTATLEAQHGVVRGFDLPRLSNELLGLKRYGDFIDLADAALSGGETAYTRAGGSLNIREGVVRTDDLTAALAAGEAKAAATVDLPAWTVDAELALGLTGAEHVRTPGVGILLTGPIDDPRQKNRLGALGKHVGKKLAGTVLRDVLGDEVDDPDEDPAERRGKTKRVLNKLLDKLEKRGRSDDPSGY